MDLIKYKINSRIAYLQKTVNHNKAREITDRYELGLNDGYIIADESNLKFLQELKKELQRV